MNSTENLFKGLFGLIVAFLLLIVALWIYQSQQPIAQHPHSEYATILNSGGHLVADPLLKWMAYCFGLGILGIFALVLLIGANKGDPDKQKKLRRALLPGLIAYFILYTLTVVVYWQYTESGASGFIFGFPTPTALMLYGLGFVPFLMTLVYIFRFRAWVLSQEEEDQFKAIVKRRNSKDQ